MDMNVLKLSPGFFYLRVVVITIAIIFNNNSKGQGFTKAFFSPQSEINRGFGDFEEVGNNQFLSLTLVGQGSFDIPVLLKYDENGELLWEKALYVEDKKKLRTLEILSWENEYGIFLQNIDAASGFYGDFLYLLTDTALNIKHCKKYSADVIGRYLYSYDIDKGTDGSLYWYYLTSGLDGGGTIGEMERNIMRIAKDGSFLGAIFTPPLNLWGSMAIDGNNNIIFNAGRAIYKLDSSWKRVFAYSVNNMQFISDIAVDDNNNIYVVDYRYNVLTSAVVKLNPQGIPIWSSQSFPNNNRPRIELDPSGNPIVFTHYYNPFDPNEGLYTYLIKHNGSDGSNMEETFLKDTFSYAPTGAIRPASQTDFSISDDNQILVFANSNYEQGFWISKSIEGLDFACDTSINTFRVNFNTSVNNQQFVFQSNNSERISDVNVIAADTQIFYLGYTCDRCYPIIDQLPNDTSICFEGEIELKVPSNALNFVWNDGVKLKERFVDTSGQFILTASNKCSNFSDTFNLVIFPKTDGNIFSSKSSVEMENYVNFWDLSSGIENRTWTINDEIISDDSSFSYLFNDPGIFNYYLERLDTNSCISIDSGSILVKGRRIYLPNAFTPNGDANNQVFKPVLTGADSYRIQIYNRWGALVYSGENGIWNGKDEKGNHLAEGLYFYTLKVKWIDGGVDNKKGEILLIR